LHVASLDYCICVIILVAHNSVTTYSRYRAGTFPCPLSAPGAPASAAAAAAAADRIVFKARLRPRAPRPPENWEATSRLEIRDAHGPPSRAAAIASRAPTRTCMRRMGLLLSLWLDCQRTEKRCCRDCLRRSSRVFPEAVAGAKDPRTLPPATLISCCRDLVRFRLIAGAAAVLSPSRPRAAVVGHLLRDVKCARLEQTSPSSEGSRSKRVCRRSPLAA